MAFESDQLYGQFLPTTRKFSEQKVREFSINSNEFKDFLVDLLQALNEISIQANEKDYGRYVLQEIINGQLFFPDPSISRTASNVQNPDYRQVFRTVVNFGALPNATSKSVAHNITTSASTTFTRIYGTATNPSTSFIPLPFSSPTLTENIKLEVDGTNVIITTGDDRSAYTTTYVVLEYLLN